MKSVFERRKGYRYSQSEWFCKVGVKRNSTKMTIIQHFDVITHHTRNTV